MVIHFRLSFYAPRTDQKNHADKRKPSPNYNNGQVPNDQKFTRD